MTGRRLNRWRKRNNRAPLEHYRYGTLTHGGSGGRSLVAVRARCLRNRRLEIYTLTSHPQKSPESRFSVVHPYNLFKTTDSLFLKHV
ncbi:hypothetical protein EVAR_99787_1 [Eumeta japonica]|uniref:Uncharacterized protein n=1 Tax=Eumeta variegata TaxID=151549 RepID=A0A4C1ZGK8_EUMVA|nr:hypothetical protein EVAR_99787_1 [Eumeta japonica]